MSKFIIKKRGKGKTTDLIKRSAETGEVIICKDFNRCRLVVKIAEDLKCLIPRPMFVKEIFKEQGRATLHERCRKSTTGKVLIDDVDDVLEALIGVPCAVVTGSPDEVNDEN